MNRNNEKYWNRPLYVELLKLAEKEGVHKRGPTLNLSIHCFKAVAGDACVGHYSTLDQAQVQVDHTLVSSRHRRLPWAQVTEVKGRSYVIEIGKHRLWARETGAEVAIGAAKSTLAEMVMRSVRKRAPAEVVGETKLVGQEAEEASG